MAAYCFNNNLFVLKSIFLGEVLDNFYTGYIEPLRNKLSNYPRFNSFTQSRWAEVVIQAIAAPLADVKRLGRVWPEKNIDVVVTTR